MISNVSQSMTSNESISVKEDKSWEMYATYCLEGILTPVISFAGIIGNIICILVLSKKRNELGLKPSFTDLLIFLAISDSLFLVFANLVYTSASHLTPDQCIPALVPLIHISLTASVYTTVAVATERAATFIPILHNKEEKEHKSQKINSNTSEIVEFQIDATTLRTNPLYSVYYTTLGNCIIMSFMPVFLLSLLNYIIYKGIKRHSELHNSISSSNHRQHRRDNTMTALLSGIVIVFFICHSTKIITHTYEAYQVLVYGQLLYWPPWAELLSRVNHFMLAANSSINIFIYVIKDFKFRAALKSMITFKGLF